MKASRYADVIALIAIGLIVLFQSTVGIYRYPAAEVQRGFIFLAIVGTMTACLSTIELISFFRRPAAVQPDRTVEEAKTARNRLVLVGSLVAGYVLLLWLAGFLIATFVFWTCTLAIYGRVHPAVSVAVAVVAALSFFFFFQGLQLSLPRGLLDF